MKYWKLGVLTYASIIIATILGKGRHQGSWQKAIVRSQILCAQDMKGIRQAL
jgi:hypothetical protein